MGVADHQDLGEREGKDLAMAIGTGGGGAMGSRLGAGGKKGKEKPEEEKPKGDNSSGNGDKGNKGGDATPGEADPSLGGKPN